MDWAKGFGAPGTMKDNGNDKNGQDGGGTAGSGTGIVTKTRPKTKKPSLYKVLLLNDDYTPMEFVVHILEKIFGKTREEAVEVMLHVHRHGVGVCGGVHVRGCAGNKSHARSLNSPAAINIL